MRPWSGTCAAATERRSHRHVRHARHTRVRPATRRFRIRDLLGSALLGLTLSNAAALLGRTWIALGLLTCNRTAPVPMPALQARQRAQGGGVARQRAQGEGA